MTENLTQALSNENSQCEFEQPIKQLVFRYQPINELTLGNLKRGEYLFSTPSELNDGNEGYPNLVVHGDKEAYLRFTYWILCECSCDIYRLRNDELSESGEVFNLLSNEVSRMSSKKSLQIEEFRDLLVDSLRNLGLEKHPVLRAILPKLAPYLKTRLIEDVNKRFSTLSFSKSADNPTMWGHYADAEQGLVIVHEAHANELAVELPVRTFVTCEKVIKEFSGQSFEINQIGSSNRGSLALEAVSYRRNRPQINLFHWFSHRLFFSEQEHHYDYPASFGSSQKAKDYEKFMLYKSTSWRYEKEVRLLLEASDRFHNTKENRIAVVGGIRAIILGRRVASDKQQRIISALKILVESGKSLIPNTILIMSMAADEKEFRYRLRINGKVDLNKNYSSFTPVTKFTKQDKEIASRLAKQIMKGSPSSM